MSLFVLEAEIKTSQAVVTMLVKCKLDKISFRNWEKSACSKIKELDAADEGKSRQYLHY